MLYLVWKSYSRWREGISCITLISLQLQLAILQSEDSRESQRKFF